MSSRWLITSETGPSWYKYSGFPAFTTFEARQLCSKHLLVDFDPELSLTGAPYHLVTGTPDHQCV